MKRPLTGLVIVYAAGIWAGTLVEWSPAMALGCAVGLLFLFLFWRKAPALLGLVFFTGLLSYREVIMPVSSQDITHLVSRGQSAWLRGVVVSEPVLAEGGRAGFKMKLSRIQMACEWESVEGQVWVSGPAGLRYGDEIECAAALRVPDVARNPGGLDWREWLALQRIYFTATVATNDPCMVVRRDRGNFLTALSLRLRERFENGLRAGLENEPEIAGVLTGMVIGKRSDIPPETYADFQRTGVFHVFAINGLHVGLVTALVLLFLGAVQVPQRWSGVVALPLLVLYVWATGAHPGAVRALAMAGVWLLGRMLVRPADGLNNLAAAALILLVWEPLQLFDGGFHLSFVVVAAILVLTSRIEAWVRPVGEVDPLIPRQFVSWWRKALDSVWGWTVRLLSCSIAAWVGLIPLLATYFHLFTPSSIVGNLLVIPLLGCVIALGLAATVVHAVWVGLAATLNNASLVLVSVMTGGMEWLGQVPGSHWYVQAPPVWWTMVYYAMGIVLVARAIPWQWRKWTVGIGAPVMVGAALFMAPPEEAVEITVLDLPDGVAMFVNLPGERDDFLIDGGGERVLLPFLRSQGVDRLGEVVLSCKDKAHAAGLSNVVAEVPVGGVVISDVAARSAAYWRWRSQVNERRIPVRAIHAGERWEVQRLKVTALNPPGDTDSVRADDNSLVLLLEYGPTRLLWMSDAGESVERRLVASGIDLKCPVLLKASHNKESSGTEELLEAVRPELVVQVVNVWPLRRYPEEALRERVERRGARWLATDETGAVTIRLTSRGYWVQTYRALERGG